MNKEQAQAIITRAVSVKSSTDVELTDDLYNELIAKFWYCFGDLMKYAAQSRLDTFTIRNMTVIPAWISWKLNDKVWDWFAPKAIQELTDIGVKFTFGKEPYGNACIFTFKMVDMREFIGVSDVVIPTITA
jgi:hypothetical protein